MPQHKIRSINIAPGSSWQKGPFQIRRFDTSMVKTAVLACVITVILAGLYSSGAVFIEPQIGPYLRTDSVGQVRSPQERRASSGITLAHPLPESWQVDWSGEKLWITHYNLDGNVADALLFDNLGNFYDWFESHPDCCDVDVGEFEFVALIERIFDYP